MLPPLDEILPVIEDYFLHVNSLLPLFAQSTFMRMLHEYYYNTSRHPRAAWAAINIVLALGTRLPTVPTNNVDLAAEDTKLAKYISNAQSVLSELVTRDEDLLGLQVLLGLVFIFDGLKDPRPATVLIGTAVRLAHRMKLHDRTRQDQYPNEETLQRKRLFWIAYMLDKDISMRHHTPSVQNDGDIDLALPEEKPADGAGLVYTKDGKVAANFFLLRVQLSHIQGRVYDLLHSTRSSKITPTERQMRINRLSRQLESWRLTLPRELQADNVLDNVDRSTLFWLATMHFTHLSCLVMTNGIWSHDVKWRKRISSYSLEAIIETGAPSCSHQPAPLPKSWDHCVEMSRYCMELTSQMPLSDCSLWANGCAYFSGMIVLMANMYEFPRHKHVQRDEELSRFSLSIFEKMTDAANEVYLRRLHGVALELLRRSTGAVEAARSQPLMPEPVAAVSELEDSRVDGSAAIAAGEGEQVEKQLSDPSEMTFDWEDPALNEWIGLDPALVSQHTSA
ncbi:hypothetical protein GQ53DRAFT_272381 [Thozetella sp. PMI_491]|nr:hypothetical protein GQ53DRAFT_272381 [Thozetella sp. PMI_491]